MYELIRFADLKDLVNGWIPGTPDTSLLVELEVMSPLPSRK